MLPENNQHAMRAGLIVGLTLAVKFITSAYPATSMFSFVFDLAVIYLAYKAVTNCRDSLNDGVISFGAAWWYVLMLYLYSAMVAGVVKFGFLRLVNRTYLDDLRVAVLELMQRVGYSAELIEQSMAGAADLFQPGNFVLYSVMGDLFTGAFVGIFIALIAKRK